MAKAAELNGYPGPKHVLIPAKELRLTDAQRQQVQVIFDRMSAAARPLGMELVGRELLLDRLFAEGEITPDRLAVETASIGTLEGSLRSVHLAAHLQTRALINSHQIALYNQLRGNESGTASSPRVTAPQTIGRVRGLTVLLVNRVCARAPSEIYRLLSMACLLSVACPRECLPRGYCFVSPGRNCGASICDERRSCVRPLAPQQSPKPDCCMRLTEQTGRTHRVR